MTVLDGEKAIQWMRKQKTWRATGLCLEVVDHAFGRPYLDRSDGKGNYGNAIQVWDRTASKYRRTSGEPPAGAILIWRHRTNSKKGHIALSLGGGRMISTYGKRTNWEGTRKLWGVLHLHHKYLGWMTHYTAPHPIKQCQNLPEPAVAKSKRPPLPTKTIKQGWRGWNVRRWKKFLNYAIARGYITGSLLKLRTTQKSKELFDKGTDTLTRKYQKFEGIAQDGVVGPVTRGKAKKR